MFLLIIQNNPNAPRPSDYLAASMAKNNAETIARNEVTTKEDQQTDQHQVLNAQSTQKQAAPAPGFLTTFISNVNNIYIPRIAQAQKLSVEALISLKNENEISLTSEQAQTVQTALIRPSAPQLVFLVKTFPGIPDFIKQLKKQYGIDDKFIKAFDKLTKIIQTEGKISKEDIINDLELSWLLKDENMETMRFIFQKVVDQIMTETKSLINDPRKKVQGIAKIALELVDKMVNSGEFWANETGLQVATERAQGRTTLWLA